MRDAGLAIRLVRGAGRRDVVRLILMATGIALATYSVLTGIAVPRVLADANSIAQAREPIIPAEQAAVTRLARRETSNERVGDRGWTRVTVQGVTNRTPLPPGLRRWPAPGESVVSPALEHLAKKSAGLRRNLGRLAPERLGASGLTSPEELYSYTVIPMANSRDPAGQPFIGFGDPGVQVIRGPSTGLVAAELSVLIGIPAALFISLCARLSVASRRERLWALSLVGMSPSRSARLFALELGLVALAGVSLGMAVYAATVPILGASGLLGITWWPGQAGLPILPAVFLGLVFVTAVVTVARITILRSAKASRSERQFERRKLLAYLGVVFLCPGAGFLAWLCLAGVVDRNRPPSLSGILPAEIMAAAALAALGLLLLMAPTLEYLARWGTRQISAIGVRLGLQLAGFHVTTTARLVSAVCGIALLGGFSCAFLASMHRDATGDPTAAGVTLDLTVVPAAERARLTRLAKYPHVESVTAVPPGPQGPGIGIIIGSCAELRVAARELFAPEVCRDKPQWGDRGAPEGVTSLPAVPLAQGHTVSIVAPGGGATAGAHWDLKLPPSAAPWALSAKVATLSFVVSSEDGTLDRLLADIHSALPSAVPQAGVKDPDLLAAYYQQTGILRSGLILGFALSLGCFLLTVLDLRWRSRRSLAAQRALGAPKWTLRVSAATQLGFPIALGGIASAIVGTIGGWAFLSYWGTREMFDPAVAAWSFGLAGVSLAVAIVFGLVSGGGKFRLSSLRDI